MVVLPPTPPASPYGARTARPFIPWVSSVATGIVLVALAASTAQAGLRTVWTSALVTQAARTLDRPGPVFAGLRIATAVTATAIAADAIRARAAGHGPIALGTSPRAATGSRDLPASAAVAFAGALALERELHGRWVPWVAYPTAGLAAWSLARGDRDAGLDVVGGAALGLLMTARVESLTHRTAGVSRIRPIVSTSRQGVRLGARLMF